MGEKDYEYGEPCPNCNSREFIEVSLCTGDVRFACGQIERFDLLSIDGETIQLMCQECEEILIDKNIES